jgi:hypothetical protein
MTPRRTTGLAAALVAFGLLAAACGGGGKKDAATTEPSTSTTEPPTTLATTTTKQSTTTVKPTTTTKAVPATWPLTGLPIQGDPKQADHAALVVKIDNHPAARPQAGLNQTDIVYEEIVEGITRFFTVFHSQIPGPVGPIRSARTQDLFLVGNLNVPLFAWSGGNPNVTRAIHNGPLIDMSAQIGIANRAGQYHRQGGYPAPHNLFADGHGLMTFNQPGATGPKPVFTYRTPSETINGVPAQGVDLHMLATNAEWRWNQQWGAYLRSNSGAPHKDQAGNQVATSNVVVLFVDYKPSPADARSPEAQTTGSGDVWIFTGGKVVGGRWTRAKASDPWTFTDGSGKPIKLTPGRTWVELARTGNAVIVK